MIQSSAYAYLKTIDGEEVMEYTQIEFNDLLKEIRFKEIKKSDRKLYFITDTIHSNGIQYFKNDYFEVVK